MTIFEISFFWFTLAPSYYWFMYAIWFMVGYYYIKSKNILSKEQLESLFLFVFVWVVFGGRIGYILFYDLWFYITNPLHIFQVWKWWMSFHGWFLWVVLAVTFFYKIHRINFWKLMDELAVIIPIWIGLWRIGNYLNKELLWFPYTGFLAVEKNGEYYFPSPLLEAFFEWLVLCILLYFINKKKKIDGITSAFFLIFYAIFRISIELFIRTPDQNIWYIAWFLTLGTLFSLPMLLLWIWILVFLKIKK